MKKNLLIVILIMLGISATFAQKKSVTAAKNLATQEKPDFKSAEKLIKEALVNDETKNDVATWYTAGFILYKKFEIERNKKVLIQKFDAPMMYAAFYDAYNYWIKCMQLDKVKPKYTVEILGKIKENISAFMEGGDYYFNNKNYQLSFQCLDTYIKAGVSEDLKSLKISDDPNYKMSPYFASLAALYCNDIKIAILALEYAKKFDYEKYKVYYNLCELYNKDKQNAKYIASLKEGYALFPNEPYFKEKLPLFK